MGLADLKKDMKSKNKKKLEDKGYASQKDERFYVPSIDENDKVNVKIRLLPSYVKDEDGTPISLEDRKSTRLNSSHRCISYAVFCLKKKKKITIIIIIILIITYKKQPCRAQTVNILRRHTSY